MEHLYCLYDELVQSSLASQPVFFLLPFGQEKDLIANPRNTGWLVRLSLKMQG